MCSECEERRRINKSIEASRVQQQKMHSKNVSEKKETKELNEWRKKNT